MRFCSAPLWLRASLRQSGMVFFLVLPGTYSSARKRASEMCRAILIRPALRDWGTRGSESFAHSGWGCCRHGERVLLDCGFLRDRYGAQINDQFEPILVITSHGERCHGEFGKPPAKFVSVMTFWDFEIVSLAECI